METGPFARVLPQWIIWVQMMLIASANSALALPGNSGLPAGEWMGSQDQWFPSMANGRIRSRTANTVKLITAATKWIHSWGRQAEREKVYIFENKH